MIGNCQEQVMNRTFGALIILSLLTGCNTIAGAGRDIQSAGETIEDAAD